MCPFTSRTLKPTLFQSMEDVGGGGKDAIVTADLEDLRLSKVKFMVTASLELSGCLRRDFQWLVWLWGGKIRSNE